MVPAHDPVVKSDAVGARRRMCDRTQPGGPSREGSSTQGRFLLSPVLRFHPTSECASSSMIPSMAAEKPSRYSGRALLPGRRDSRLPLRNAPPGRAQEVGRPAGALSGKWPQLASGLCTATCVSCTSRGCGRIVWRRAPGIQGSLRGVQANLHGGRHEGGFDVLSLRRKSRIVLDRDTVL